MTRARCLLLLLLLPLAGCGTLRDDVPTAWWRCEEGDTPFLGVVVKTGKERNATLLEAVDALTGQGREGAVVVSVLRESPAAGMGIVPGDAIVRYGALPVRNAGELRGAIHRVPNESKIDVTVERGGQELVLQGWVNDQSTYANKAQEALRLAEEKGQTSLPFLFKVEEWHIDAATWAAWTGSQPTGDVVGYSETNILPILVNTLSLFRYESTECLEDRSRVMFLTWPLIYTSSAGDEDERRGEVDALPMGARL